MNAQEKLQLIAAAQKNNRRELSGIIHEGQRITLAEVCKDVMAMYPGKNDYIVNENLEVISFKELKQARQEGRYSLRIEDGFAILDM